MYKISGWNYKRLSEVAKDWLFGKTLPRSNISYYSSKEGIPWVKAEDINEGLLTASKEYITKEGQHLIRTIQAGAVLVSCAGTIGKVAIAGVDLTCNQAVQGILFDEKQIIPKYGYYYLLNQGPQLKKIANQVTVPNLTKYELKNFPIGFPSIEVQQRIVSVLENAQKAVSIKNEEEELLENYLAAIFSSCMKSADNNISLKPLGKLLSVPPLKGTSLKQAGYKTDYRLINNFGKDSFIWKENPEGLSVIPSQGQINKYRIYENDILLRFPSGRCPQILLLGKPGDTVPILGSSLIGLRPDIRKVLPEYLYIYLYFFLKSSNMESISIDILNQLMIPVITPGMQESFRRQFSGFLLIKGWLEKTKKEAELLFEGLLQRIFLGLWPQKDGIVPDDVLFEILPHVNFIKPDKEKQNKLILERIRKVSQKLNDFLNLLSPFQKAVFEELLQFDTPQAAHTLFAKILKKQNYNVQLQNYSIQDVLSVLDLLEEFGILKKVYTSIKDPFSKSAELLRDHNNKPVYGILYYFIDELLEEGEDEINQSSD